MSRFSRISATLPVLAAVLTLGLSLTAEAEVAPAADEPGHAVPQAPPGGNSGGTLGRSDPEIIAPDADGDPSEDGTADAPEEKGTPPPGGCQFRDQPLELIV